MNITVILLNTVSTGNTPITHPPTYPPDTYPPTYPPDTYLPTYYTSIHPSINLSILLQWHLSIKGVGYNTQQVNSLFSVCWKLEKWAKMGYKGCMVMTRKPGQSRKIRTAKPAETVWGTWQGVQDVDLTPSPESMGCARHGGSTLQPKRPNRF